MNFLICTGPSLLASLANEFFSRKMERYKNISATIAWLSFTIFPVPLVNIGCHCVRKVKSHSMFYHIKKHIYSVSSHYNLVHSMSLISGVKVIHTFFVRLVKGKSSFALSECMSSRQLLATTSQDDGLGYLN